MGRRTLSSQDPPPKDRSGERYGRLIIVSFSHRERHSNGTKLYWNCLCDCGEMKSIISSSLGPNGSQSCGCLTREVNRAMRTTHGMTDSPTYKSWEAMWKRTTNPKAINNERYGALGIRVCDQWESFEIFLADMGERPEGKTLDRWPDKMGNYEPGNCRWATPKEQSNHRKSNHMIVIDGASKNLGEWCEHYKQDYDRVEARINRYGWEPRIALETPKGGKR